MAKAKHNATVEVAKAAPTVTAPRTCANCSFSRESGWGLMCGVRLPPWVKRSDRPADNVVRPADTCDLYRQF